MIMIAWIIAIALLTTIFGSWEDKQINPNSAPDTYQTQNGVEVTLQRNRYGHYLVSGTVNHQDAIFMLDTGATLVAIPGEIQQELGLISGQSHYTHTANGTAKAYYTVIDRLTIGDIVIRDVKASIVPNMEGRQILLGMSVLKELEFTQKGKQLTLRQVY
ncbi:TIGR02281 family clan AA aspartic protease [Aliikangiella coralliicola]|uniref:TIGR02281 family clan AA aspartic protease n=2 Tax=Aliikangiella coralliicola TaxID=2592383 RepID=A0A545U0M4_9GAMM|nr:TIGR02281 family clan AA aspartic protease [Aliikangiella coralliicola]